MLNKTAHKATEDLHKVEVIDKNELEALGQGSTQSALSVVSV